MRTYASYSGPCRREFEGRLNKGGTEVGEGTGDSGTARMCVGDGQIESGYRERSSTLAKVGVDEVDPLLLFLLLITSNLSPALTAAHSAVETCSRTPRSADPPY